MLMNGILLMSLCGSAFSPGGVLHLLLMTQKVSRIWYHTAPPWVEPDTPSLTKPNLA